jgi:hypothetical protein
MLLNLAVARETQITFVGHYDAQTAPFLMVAAVHGVAFLSLRMLLEKSKPASPSLPPPRRSPRVRHVFPRDVRTAFQLMNEFFPDAAAPPVRPRIAHAREKVRRRAGDVRVGVHRSAGLYAPALHGHARRRSPGRRAWSGPLNRLRPARSSSSPPTNSAAAPNANCNCSTTAAAPSWSTARPSSKPGNGPPTPRPRHAGSA